MDGSLRFKIDWASVIVGSKLTVFALFQFVFERNFQVQAPGGLIFGGAISQKVFDVTSLGGLNLEGLIHGGAYFQNFTVYLTIIPRAQMGSESITHEAKGRMGQTQRL